MSLGCIVVEVATVYPQLLRKFIFAWEGFKAAVRSEQSLRIQLAVSVAVVLAGGLLGITKPEWLFVITAIGIVISLELLNTAIEKMLDLLHPAKHDSVKFVKDVSAAAVLISSLAAVIIGLIIFSRHLF
jgi:diacylglycerol kinase